MISYNTIIFGADRVPNDRQWRNEPEGSYENGVDERFDILRRQAA
jgi:hypothetical protein